MVKNWGLQLNLILLIIFFSCGKDSQPNQPPVVSIAASATEGNAPLEVKFTAQCSDPDGECVKYEWDFGDGSEHAFVPETSHTYAGFGEFTVKLIVTDNNGGTGEAEQIIKVSDIRVFYPADGDRVGWWEPEGAKVLIKAGGSTFESIEKMELYIDDTNIGEASNYGGVFERYWWSDKSPDGEHSIYAKVITKSGKTIVTKKNKFFTHNSIDIGGKWITSDFQTGADIWYGINEQWEKSYIGIVDLGNYPYPGFQPGDMAVELDPQPNQNNGINMCRNPSDPEFKIRIHVDAGQTYKLQFWWWGPSGFLHLYLWSYIDGAQLIHRTLQTENAIEFTTEKTDIICVAFIGVSFNFFLDDIQLERIN